ncbi:Lipase [Porphyridium purpureum]|uniref:Lipase n=1 Tax=Porphyridium purpureum TaxID=35688 RepID=A0A5J4YHL7_PORPP|nr:Lipase [Porphyridium purpureum]|eukprot:POR3317..scf270_19
MSAEPGSEPAAPCGSDVPVGMPEDEHGTAPPPRIDTMPRAHRLISRVDSLVRKGLNAPAALYENLNDVSHTSDDHDDRDDRGETSTARSNHSDHQQQQQQQQQQQRQRRQSNADEEVKFVTDVFEMHSRGTRHKLLMETFSGSQMTGVLAIFTVGILLSLSFAIVIALSDVGTGNSASLVYDDDPDTSAQLDTLFNQITGNLNFQIIMGFVVTGLFILVGLDLLFACLRAPKAVRLPQQLLILGILPFIIMGAVPFRTLSVKKLFEETDFSSGDRTYESLSEVLQAEQGGSRSLPRLAQAFYALYQGVVMFYMLVKPRMLGSIAPVPISSFVLIAVCCSLYVVTLCISTVYMELITNLPVFCGFFRVIRCLTIGINSEGPNVSVFTFCVLLFLALIEISFMVTIFMEISRAEFELRGCVYQLFRAQSLALSMLKVNTWQLVITSWICTAIQFSSVNEEEAQLFLNATGRLFTDEVRFSAASFTYLAFLFVEVILSYPATAKRILLIPLKRVVQMQAGLEWKARMSHDSDGNVICEPRVLVLEMLTLMMNFSALAYKFGSASLDEAGEAELDHRAQSDLGVLTKNKFRLVHHMQHGESDTHGIVCEADDCIVVAFRGTKSAQNIKSDLRAASVSLKKVLGTTARAGQGHTSTQDIQSRSFEEVLSRVSIPEAGHLRLSKCTDLSEDIAVLRDAYDHAHERFCRVHGGFADAYISVRDEVAVLVQVLLAIKQRPVFVTGHSLGGALATLCAYHLSKVCSESVREKLVLVTCGSPRVGNFFFNRRFKERVPNAWRIHVERDPVPRVPKAPYMHVGTQVILRVDGEIVADPGIVEELHFKRQRIKVAHHRMWIYRGIVEAFCSLYTSPGFVPDIWIMGEACPDELRKAVRPPADKFRNAQLLKVETLIREHMEFGDLYETFHATISESAACNWRSLVDHLLEHDEHPTNPRAHTQT